MFEKIFLEESHATGKMSSPVSGLKRFAKLLRRQFQW
jgi:hypothetical protein